MQNLYVMKEISEERRRILEIICCKLGTACVPNLDPDITASVCFKLTIKLRHIINVIISQITHT